MNLFCTIKGHTQGKYLFTMENINSTGVNERIYLCTRCKKAYTVPVKTEDIQRAEREALLDEITQLNEEDYHVD